MKYYIGVDPGNTGGLALINSAGNAIEYERMSKTQAQCIIDFISRANNLATRNNLVCFFEEHKGGGENTNAAAHRSAGYYAGIVETACAVYGVKLVTFTPQTWKSAFGLIVRQTKGAPKLSQKDKREIAKAKSIALAKKKFPTINLLFPRCINEHDGCAEALLIAEYGRMVDNSQTY